MTRLSAGGVADEWAIQMLRQRDSQVFKKHSQMKLQMKSPEQNLPAETHASLEVRDAQLSTPPGSLVLLSDPICIYEFILSLQAFH